jgi:hypothetical protein
MRRSNEENGQELTEWQMFVQPPLRIAHLHPKKNGGAILVAGSETRQGKDYMRGSNEENGQDLTELRMFCHGK